MTEAQLQQKIFQYYHNKYCTAHNNPQHIIFSVPNESSNAKEQMYKKSLGLIAGVSDLIIIRPNEVLFVEVKTTVGRQSDKQKAFQSKVELLGFKYFLVRSEEDFKAIPYLESL